MAKYFRSGELICNELGVTAQSLATACNAGKIIAYSRHTGEPIVPSHKCETRFKFAQRPIRFRLTPSYPYVTLAIRDICLKKMDVYVRNTVINSRAKSASVDERQERSDISDFRESVAVLAARRAEQFAKQIKQDALVHKNKRYVLYLPPEGLIKLGRAGQEVFPVDDFSFQIFNDVYDFEFECLYIMRISQASHVLIPWKTSIVCKDIKSSFENRKCFDKWDTVRVCFDTRLHVCEQSGIDVDYSRIEIDPEYRNKHAKCEVIKQQRQLEYFKQ